MRLRFSVGGLPRKVHNLIGERIEPEQAQRIFEMRLRATHWIDGIAVGDWIWWNPARDIASLATFQVLSSYTPKGCNSVYRVDLGRVWPDVWIMGKCYVRPQPW